jgi:hypothetical protein
MLALCCWAENIEKGGGLRWNISNVLRLRLVRSRLVLERIGWGCHCEGDGSATF